MGSRDNQEHFSYYITEKGLKNINRPILTMEERKLLIHMKNTGLPLSVYKLMSSISKSWIFTKYRLDDLVDMGYVNKRSVDVRTK